MSTAFNVWTPEGIVISGSSVGNQSVIYDTNPIILTSNTHVFKMWYGDFATGAINYMESADGLTSWTAYSSNPLGVTAYFPVVWKVGSTYYLYASTSESTNTIALWTSPDGVTWTFSNNVITVGSAGSWDSNNVSQLNLCAIVGGTWYAYYSGGNGSVFQSGLATSTNNGVTWTKNYSVTITSPFGPSDTTAFMQVNGIYYGWGVSVYNTTNTSVVAHAHVRWSAPTPAGPWTQLTYNGNPVMVYYPATSAELTNGIATQIGDQCLVVANGNIYLYYDIGAAGGEGAIGQAIATGFTPAQLVATYEGVVGAPSSGNPQLNLVTLASDPGTGSNASPIGGNWTPLSTTTPFNAAQRLSNKIQSTTLANNNDSFWNAISWANDQWSQITVALVTTTSDIGPEVRMNTSGTATCYRMQWGGGALGSAQSALIRKVIAGTATTLYTATGLKVSAGDTLLGVVNGTNIYLYYNGICIGAVSDSSVTSGASGFEMFGNSSSGNAQIGAFSGGSFQNAPPINPPVSGAFSVQDCRNYFHFPNGYVLTNGTEIFTLQTSSNPAVPSKDCRVAGPPVPSLISYPQNSRNGSDND